MPVRGPERVPHFMQSTLPSMTNSSLLSRFSRLPTPWPFFRRPKHYVYSNPHQLNKFTKPQKAIHLRTQFGSLAQHAVLNALMPKNTCVFIRPFVNRDTIKGKGVLQKSKPFNVMRETWRLSRVFCAILWRKQCQCHQMQVGSRVCRKVRRGMLVMKYYSTRLKVFERMKNEVCTT